MVLSNTNRLHTASGRRNTRKSVMLLTISICRKTWVCTKPEARIYQHVLQAEGFHQTIRSFDDNADNIEGANQLGITSILVKDRNTIPTISRRCYVKTIQDKAGASYPSTMGRLKLLWQRIDEDNMTTSAGNLCLLSLLSH